MDGREEQVLCAAGGLQMRLGVSNVRRSAEYIFTDVPFKHTNEIAGSPQVEIELAIHQRTLIATAILHICSRILVNFNYNWAAF
jgi:hypothetical protein